MKYVIDKSFMNILMINTFAYTTYVSIHVIINYVKYIYFCTYIYITYVYHLVYVFFLST